MDERMFCFQCEQAANCTACTGAAGVCGKSADTAAAQDRLTGALITCAGQLLADEQSPSAQQAMLLMQGLFTTITNVNFDAGTVDELTAKVRAACPAAGPGYDMQLLWHEPDADVRSLKSFVLFSLRGMAAYNYHARVLGHVDPELDRFFCTALDAISRPLSMDELWALVQKTGEASYRCMELLDAANTGAYGDPVPAEVPLTIEKGPFIVVSGHDLYDMKCLLEQTKDKGINIYTHSEMLPAHGYPELKQKYPHLKGNFGTAWQNQQTEFEDIPAPILFTTNCIMPLRESYADRVFTTSVVSYPGIVHIEEGRDFTPVIEKALALGGYGVLLVLCLTGFSGNLVLLCVPGVVVFACNGMLSVLTTLFLSNSVDYGQLKTGRREESVIFSMQTFVVKAASGVAVFLTGIGLDLIGLVGNTEETGPVAAQSASTLLGLRLMMTVLPMLVLAGVLVLFRRKFVLTDARAAEISAQLHGEEAHHD